MGAIDTSRLEAAFGRLLGTAEPFEPVYRAEYVSEHPTAPNKHIVRVLRPDNTVNEEIEVYGQVLGWPGLQVRLAHQRKEWSGQLAIIGADAMGHLGFDVPPINQGKHGHFHGWLMPDETANLFTQQIRPLRCQVTSGWAVKVLAGYVYIDRQIKYLQDPIAFSLGAYVPGTGGQWVTVSLDSDLNVVLTPSGQKTDRHSIDAPNPPWGNWWIASVWLDSSQSELERIDIIDGRFLDASRLSGVTVPFTGDLDLTAEGLTTVEGIQGRPVTTTAPVDKDVLTYNATIQAWEPKPVEVEPGNGGGVLPRYAVVINPTLYVRYRVDGTLALADEADGPWFIPGGYKISRFLAYLQDTGAGGGTNIFDLDTSTDGASWTSIFSNPADRPSIAGAGANVLKVAYTDDAFVFFQEMLLRLNLEQVAAQAEGLIVQLECESAIRDKQDFIPAVAAFDGSGAIVPSWGQVGRGFACADDEYTRVVGGGYTLPPKYVEGTDVTVKVHYYRDTAWEGAAIALNTYVKVGSPSGQWAAQSHYKEEILPKPDSGKIYLGNEITFDSAQIGDAVRLHSLRDGDDPGDDMIGDIYILGWTITYKVEY